MFSTPGILVNFIIRSLLNISIAEVVPKLSLQKLAKPACVENVVRLRYIHQVIIDEILYLN